MPDLLAHEEQDGFNSGQQGGLGADHECESACAGADDAARHGRIDEVSAMAGCRTGLALDQGGNIAGGCGVDRGAVNEEAGFFSRRGWKGRGEDCLEDGLDVVGFGKSADDIILLSLRSVEQRKEVGVWTQEKG